MFPFQKVLVAVADPARDHWLVRYADMLAGLAPHTSFHQFTVCRGDVIDTLLEQTDAGGYDLVLCGDRYKQNSRRTLLRRFAMRTPASLWIVPGSAPMAISPLLLADDASSGARHAIGAGRALDASAIPFTVHSDDNVVESLLDFAVRNNSRLIVMGARGQNESGSVSLGAVAEQMIFDSHLPLLIVRSPRRYGVIATVGTDRRPSLVSLGVR